MTKQIRVENADNSPYKVVVEVWDKGYTAADGTVHPDKCAQTLPLDHPCALATVHITSTRYLVIKEA